jgi:hypothetical protein
MRHIYRAPGEVRPRATASGGENVIRLGAISPTLAYPVRSSAPACPAWECGATPTEVVDGPAYYWPRPIFGATSLVSQPPPSTGVSTLVPSPTPPSLAPTPSPTVAVAPAQTAPSLSQPGLTLDSSGASTTTTPAVTDVGTWLSEQTLVSGFANWEVTGAALLVGLFLFRGRGRR